jgi:hypothetical protein
MTVKSTVSEDFYWVCHVTLQKIVPLVVKDVFAIK